MCRLQGSACYHNLFSSYRGNCVCNLGEPGLLCSKVGWHANHAYVGVGSRAGAGMGFRDQEICSAASVQPQHCTGHGVACMPSRPGQARCKKAAQCVCHLLYPPPSLGVPEQLPWQGMPHLQPPCQIAACLVWGAGGGGMSASASASASTPRQGSVAASAHAACCGHPSATAKLRGSGHMAATSGPPALARANPKHAARERRCAERVVREGACMHACRSIHRSNQLQRSGGHTQPAHWDARVRVRACACA